MLHRRLQRRPLVQAERLFNRTANVHRVGDEPALVDEPRARRLIAPSLPDLVVILDAS